MQQLQAVYYKSFSLLFHTHICFKYTEITKEMQDAIVVSISGLSTYVFAIFHHVIKQWKNAITT